MEWKKGKGNAPGVGGKKKSFEDKKKKREFLFKNTPSHEGGLRWGGLDAIQNQSPWPGQFSSLGKGGRPVKIRRERQINAKKERKAKSRTYHNQGKGGVRADFTTCFSYKRGRGENGGEGTSTKNPGKEKSN